MYFEDLNRAPNKEFGPKDIFEIASNYMIECDRSSGLQVTLAFRACIF